ncbi:MAG: peptidase M48, partial [Burkholderiaceae bacterium]
TRLESLTQTTAPAQRLTNLLNAELALASGQPPPSLQPLGRPELLMSAQILTGQGRAAEASQSLLAWVATHPRDASAWQLLSGASSAQGQVLRAIRADAEARVAQMDYAGALERFKAGQTMVRNAKGAGVDHIEASIIDTRARVVQSLFREQSLER